jgi:mannose-6-phosphate isomerase-like protein (cupin superfamily)
MGPTVRIVERLTFGDVSMIVRASAESTGGSMAVIEEVPPLVDTPAHVHAREDELFVSLGGDHIVEIGAEEHRIGPGESVFAPRGVPHSQRRVVPGEGRLLVVVSPGGLEGFFRELAAADAAGTLGPEAYAAASERYGIAWL